MAKQSVVHIKQKLGIKKPLTSSHNISLDQTWTLKWTNQSPMIFLRLTRRRFVKSNHSSFHHAIPSNRQQWRVCPWTSISCWSCSLPRGAQLGQEGWTFLPFHWNSKQPTDANAIQHPQDEEPWSQRLLWRSTWLEHLASCNPSHTHQCWVWWSFEGWFQSR